MSTCTGLGGYCVAGDLWSHESAHIRLPDGSELYVAQYLNQPAQLLLQAGFAVRSVTAGEVLDLIGRLGERGAEALQLLGPIAGGQELTAGAPAAAA
ncbi:hypothetical protein [Streptomyces sp. CB03911]|uniref:hypothetical protein n=1 Tax=Streptomyces sp. CB03911 TaxID=1804758 RepID=UPI00093E910A|nr:hypothetical protein [Streptomyces sp. CB03911]OKI16585.1 hypothetical protein A6A07_11295 [Streptomyces sp. CB03911]